METKRTVLIVGGSKGIGNAILTQAGQNDHVINFSRTEPEGTGSNIEHHTLDVLKDELPELEELDTIIYCPGSINLKPIGSLSEDDFRDDFEINVIGAIRVIRKYLKVLRKGSNPSILLFSTVATKLGMPFHSSVAAAKSAVEGLMRSLAAELAPTIRVNAIAPTVTNTELASKLMRNEKMIDALKERHPLKGYLEPSEVAEMAAFLISNKGRSVTGQIWNMDMGIVTIKP